MELELTHIELDGTRLSEWQLSSGLSRSTLYELLKLLKIEPEGRRVASSRKLVSYLSTAQIQILEQWSAAIKNGATMPQIRERIGSTAPAAEIIPVPTAPAAEIIPILSETISGSSETVQDSDLIQRLKAADLAVCSGLGLTTRELRWILGVIPGGDVITRAGITCIKTGKNCWLMSRS